MADDNHTPQPGLLSSIDVRELITEQLASVREVMETRMRDVVQTSMREVMDTSIREVVDTSIREVVNTSIRGVVHARLGRIEARLDGLARNRGMPLSWSITVEADGADNEQSVNAPPAKRVKTSAGRPLRQVHEADLSPIQYPTRSVSRKGTSGPDKKAHPFAGYTARQVHEDDPSPTPCPTRSVSRKGSPQATVTPNPSARSTTRQVHEADPLPTPCPTQSISRKGSPEATVAPASPQMTVTPGPAKANPSAGSTPMTVTPGPAKVNPSAGSTTGQVHEADPSPIPYPTRSVSRKGSPQTTVAPGGPQMTVTPCPAKANPSAGSTTGQVHEADPSPPSSSPLSSATPSPTRSVSCNGSPQTTVTPCPAKKANPSVSDAGPDKAAAPSDVPEVGPPPTKYFNPRKRKTPPLVAELQYHNSSPSPESEGAVKVYNKYDGITDIHSMEYPCELKLRGKIGEFQRCYAAPALVRYVLEHVGQFPASFVEVVRRSARDEDFKIDRTRSRGVN